MINGGRCVHCSLALLVGVVKARLRLPQTRCFRYTCIYLYLAFMGLVTNIPGSIGNISEGHLEMIQLHNLKFDRRMQSFLKVGGLQSLRDVQSTTFAYTCTYYLFHKHTEMSYMMKHRGFHKDEVRKREQVKRHGALQIRLNIGYSRILGMFRRFIHGRRKKLCTR